jgi:hypothetical protein
MPFLPDPLYLEELLKLLPSPDIVCVEAIFRRALEEGGLVDSNGTPAWHWRQRFETHGGVVIDWNAGAMFIPWFDHHRNEWGRKPIRPQFRRADWLALFPVATEEKLTPEEVEAEEVSAPKDVLAPKLGLKVPLSVLEPWYEERVRNWPPGQNPPSEDDDWEAARAQFSEFRVTRDQIRKEVRPKRAPLAWKAKGRRPDSQDPDKLAEKIAKKRADNKSAANLRK